MEIKFQKRKSEKKKKTSIRRQQQNNWSSVNNLSRKTGATKTTLVQTLNKNDTLNKSIAKTNKGYIENNTAYHYITAPCSQY